MAPRTSSRAKSKAVNYNEDSPGPEAKPTKATSKTTSKPASKPASSATLKRKAEAEDKEDKKTATSSTSETQSSAAPKKRKTKKSDDNGMPLAERTVVSALGKAMYIGAHVSAAGGAYWLRFLRCHT